MILLAALVALSLVLVHTAYEARRLFTALDKARGEQHSLDAEAKRLDAERLAAATNLRVEKVARERLQMRSPTPAITVYVDRGASGARR
jgi:cell division protein FtsL